MTNIADVIPTQPFGDSYFALSPQEEVVWVAGVISIYGSFTYLEKRRVPRFVLRSVLNPEVVVRVAQMANANVGEFTANGGAKGVIVQVTGGPLDKLMRKLWPYLTDHRRKEYEALKASIQARAEQEAIRKKRARDGVKAAIAAKKLSMSQEQEQALRDLAARQDRTLKELGYATLDELRADKKPMGRPPGAGKRAGEMTGGSTQGSTGG